MKQIVSLFALAACLTGLCRPLEAQEPKTGTIVGAVLDAASGARVRQVRVQIEGQPSLSTETDLDGNYTLKVPAGTYKLHFAAENYHEMVLTDIVVISGAVLDTSTVMSNKSTITTTIDVTEQVGALATADAMLSERKLAPSVSDSISSEEIRKTVASDAAGAVEKVTGVSIVGDGYVYVRGLGELN